MYRNELRVRVDIRHQSSTFKAGTAAAREPNWRVQTTGLKLELPPQHL